MSSAANGVAAENPMPWPDITPGAEIIVGLSGGVDSAVALALLQEADCAVRAVFMKNWDEDDDSGYCAAAEDLQDAERVCEHLGVELRTVNLSTEYWENVFSAFVDSYRRGQTPNPDVLCNSEIKFRAFLDFAIDLGADLIATGHYARIEHRAGRYRLLKGSDADKDQSYFLCLLDQGQLERAVFPLGVMQKTEVRRLARRLGLHNHSRRDSTGICFIGERPFKTFLERFLPRHPGPIVSAEGRELGAHDGLIYYTIGQRQGLGIGGDKMGNGRAWYVAAKDFERNELIVVQGRDHPRLHASALSAAETHWIAGQVPQLPFSCHAKIRYRQPDQACTIDELPNAACRVTFQNPQWAIAPGQTIVFYDGDECLGGATIRDSLDA
jgi:tRNA-specific 2-thiouridylase